MSMKGLKNRVGEEYFGETWLQKCHTFPLKEEKRSLTRDQHFGGGPYVFSFLVNIHKNDPELEYKKKKKSGDRLYSWFIYWMPTLLLVTIPGTGDTK